MATDTTPDILEEAKQSAQRIGLIEQLASDLSDVDKLELIARLANSVQFKREHDNELARLRRRNMLKFLEELEAMPSEPNGDNFSGRDHDKILSGSPQ